MVWQLHVSGERFWEALLHCSNPVYLSDHQDSDLRLIATSKRNAILPSASSDPTTMSLDFYDKQDFVRFVLAYLGIENI